jgi:hypothetical protein
MPMIEEPISIEAVVQEIAAREERRHPCDLCPKLRPSKPRNLGTRTIDCFWACAMCAWAWPIKLQMDEGGGIPWR